MFGQGSTIRIFLWYGGINSSTLQVEVVCISTWSGSTWRTWKYGCFLKWWYPGNTPKWPVLVGKPMVVGYHHFRKPPYVHLKFNSLTPENYTGIPKKEAGRIVFFPFPSFELQGFLLLTLNSEAKIYGFPIFQVGWVDPSPNVRSEQTSLATLNPGQQFWLFFRLWRLVSTTKVTSKKGVEASKNKAPHGIWNIHHVQNGHTGYMSLDCHW